ncbi:MAG: hypothetical protein ACYTGG_10360 [Planctomycetota bacterium]|jgi:hypothetical protein
MSEVAVLNVPRSTFSLDGEAIEPRNVHAIAMLPGWHRVEWEYRFPNGFQQMQAVEFRAEAGERYRLGQRFFAEPHPDGALGEIPGFTIAVLTLPIAVFIPADTPAAPPPGEYYYWIVHVESERVVAGWAPEVGSSHQVITHVPVNDL